MRASLAASLLLPLAVANAQSATDIVKFIKQTITDIQGLNSTLNSFPDDATDLGLTVFGLLSGANALSADLTNTTSAATASPKLNDQDSQTVFDALFTLVEPTFSLLDNFVAHCPAFANTGLQPTVAQQITGQLSAVSNETNALVSKLASAQASSASVGAQLFSRAFSSVLKVYSGGPCNSTNACTATAFGSGSAGGSTGASGSSPASNPASITSMQTSATSTGPFVPQTPASTFTGAAVKDKRSPIGSLLAMI